jgi:putative SOS response-associated peptidase YedK
VTRCRKRRYIVLVDGFFEWKAIKGQRAKQPYAIAMKDGPPFGLAGTRAAGFVLTRQEPAGKWGAATNSLVRTSKA